MKKKQASKLLSGLLALTMVLSLWIVPAAAEDGNPTGASGATKADSAPALVSMTAPGSFVAEVYVDMTEAEAKAAIAAPGFQWKLTRELPYLGSDQYPNYFKGTSLASFPTLGKDADGNVIPFFTNIKTGVKSTSDAVYVTVSFDSVNFFGNDPSIPQGNNAFMDYIGDYFLWAGDLGAASLRVYPYESFHTMDELYSEIAYLAGMDTPYYVEQFSMGKSQAGMDMPYLVVAKSKAAVDNWVALKTRAEANPTAVLSELKSGKLDGVQVPVMFSNVHANESSAPDAIMNFAHMLLEQESIPMDVLTGFTDAGKEELARQMGPAGEAGSIAVPDLVKDSATYLGYLKAAGSGTDWDGSTVTVSAPVDLEKFYTQETQTVKVADLLEDVFFILVPEENVEGRTYMTRTSSGGFDLNRDNSFQTQAETQNMTHLIASWNPVSFTEFHGRVKTFQCEPCDPPHEPNFEYDLLAQHLMAGGEALGIAAVANNDGFNSYVIPQRDYLEYTGEKTANGQSETYWADPWDDMSTSYTPQYAMLHGTVAYTVEAPAYNEHSTTAMTYGQLGQSIYVAENKLSYLENQLTIFERGATNFNSNAYDLVGQWFADQNDIEGAESDLFRPTYSAAGENGNFYPECYIIPLDGSNQKNLQAADDMLAWLDRNGVQLMTADKAFTVGGVTYPAGTAVVSMYQAKRSVANGALYNGTLITDWTILYSEGITAFNHTRGFDMVTCAKNADYKTVTAACSVADEWSVKSSFSGAENGSVILSNASEDSTTAVNALLKAGKTVGFITEGEHKGSFVCSYADWQSVSGQYLLTGLGVETAPKAQAIKHTPTLYISGKPEANKTGYINTTLYASSYDYNYDRQSMELLGFQTTNDPAKADVIVGAAALDAAATPVVLSGKPYIGYGRKAIASIAGSADKDGSLFAQGVLVREAVSSESMDALAYVTYPTESLTTASYVAEGDNILYGYGAGYFATLPEGAQTLVKLDGSKQPLEGFLNADGEHYEDFLNDSIQAIAYQGEGVNGAKLNVTLFANTLTNKVHQRDEYAFISNTVFATLLGGDYAAVKAATTAYADVKSGDWYAESVGGVTTAGLMNGTSATAFAPGDTITRQMAVTTLHRMVGAPKADAAVLAPFTDSGAVADWALSAVAWAVENGVLTGSTATTINPGGTISRQELAALLYRCIQKNGGGFTGSWMFLLDVTDRDQIAQWAYEPVCFLSMNGIMTGKGNQSFDPTGSATRAELSAILLRSADLLKAAE